jgi:hypothetical protein
MALEHAGIEMRFSAPESKAPTLKTLLYRGSATEIIDSILSVFRAIITNVMDDLAESKRIGDPSAYKFVSRIRFAHGTILARIYWHYSNSFERHCNEDAPKGHF